MRPFCPNLRISSQDSFQWKYHFSLEQNTIDKFYLCHLFLIIKQGDCDECHERERLWWSSWERKIGTGQMRERLQEVSVMGRLLSTQPIHCTPKPLCIVSRYILQCIAFWGIMIHSQALNSVPKRPDGSQRLSLWLWYRLGSRQPVIIAPPIVSIINIILIDVIIVIIIGELQYQSPLISLADVA